MCRRAPLEAAADASPLPPAPKLTSRCRLGDSGTFPAGPQAVLNFVGRGRWRDSAGRRGFSGSRRRLLAGRLGRLPMDRFPRQALQQVLSTAPAYAWRTRHLRERLSSKVC